MLGMDTEFVRERTFYAQLGLVQISDGRRVWLIDTVTLRDLAPLRDILQHSTTQKVFHSPKEDLEVLSQATGALPQPLFDTQAAAALCGRPLQSSYGSLLQAYTGIELDKELARSNWLQRPLPAELLNYASCDVAYLPLLAQLLTTELEALQRLPWLEQDMAWMLAESQRETDPQSLYLNINGAGRLDDRGLACLQQLCIWREEQAKQRDLPRQFVIRNESLIQIAEQSPRHLDDLNQITRLNSGQVRRFGEDILRLVDTSTDLPPPPPPAMLDSQDKKRLKGWQSLIREYGAQLELEPTLLASRRDLLRWMKQGSQQIPSRLRGWRQDIFGQDLIQDMEETARGSDL